MTATRTRLGPVDGFTVLPAVVAVGTRTFFLVNDGTAFRLLSNVCPHQGSRYTTRGADSNARCTAGGSIAQPVAV